MITAKQIEKNSMTEEKKKESRYNLLSTYCWRPIAYWLTIPFIYLKVSPNLITIISIFFSIIGFFFISFSKTTVGALIGCFFYFLWIMFDCIDGTIARYNKSFSMLGDLLDTLSGYITMIGVYFSIGIYSYYSIDSMNLIFFSNKEYLIILGGMTSIFSILPRLMLHKKNSLNKDNDLAVNSLKNKSDFSKYKVIILNFISISEFVQIFLIASIILNWTEVFVLFYFLLNFLIAVMSIIQLFFI